MIISNDLKSVYLSAPKTGSRTANAILKNYGTIVGDHLTATETLMACGRKIKDFNYQTVENIYVFWRDPVDRFISAVNFLRANRPVIIITKNPEWFREFDCSKLITTSNTGHQTFDYSLLTPEMCAAVKAITPEQIFDAHIDAKMNNPNASYAFLDKQSKWIQEGLNILDYADFDANMRIVMDSFGVPANTAIPVLNSSESLTTSLSPKLEAKVKAYYAEDYQLKPA